MTNSVEQKHSTDTDIYLETQKISQHFMLPENSLPYLQEPASGPYPEPDESSPHIPIYVSKMCVKFIRTLLRHFSSR
jgi:hypothetical protein